MGKKSRILIIGASGFLGNALYRELNSYFDTYGTYNTDSTSYDQNQKFFPYDMETEDIRILLDNLKPHVIITALRGNFNAQIDAHFRMMDWVQRHANSRIFFISSANVFDTFRNYPSYEYDKSFSESIYGRFKIKIENALLRMANSSYVIVRLPMVFGAGSPRLSEIKQLHHLQEPIEVFPNVIMNATTVSKFTQQAHYIINRKKTGVFHLGSTDLTHHDDLIKDICKVLELNYPVFKQVYDSNDDRYLAVLPKDNLLPKNLNLTIDDVVRASLLSHNQ